MTTKQKLQAIKADLRLTTTSLEVLAGYKPKSLITMISQGKEPASIELAYNIWMATKAKYQTQPKQTKKSPLEDN